MQVDQKQEAYKSVTVIQAPERPPPRTLSDLQWNNVHIFITINVFYIYLNYYLKWIPWQINETKIN